MRNLLRRSFLLGALLLGTAFLGSDIFTAEPAGAATVPWRAAPIVASSSEVKRPAAARPSPPRSTPSRVARTSRSGVRQRVVRPRAVPTGDVWARLRACESGGRYDINTGNGYFGAYQFHPRTWRGLGYPGLPHQAPPEVQDEAARKLQARSGWGQWPACSRRLGLR